MGSSKIGPTHLSVAARFKRKGVVVTWSPCAAGNSKIGPTHLSVEERFKRKET